MCEAVDKRGGGSGFGLSLVAERAWRKGARRNAAGKRKIFELGDASSCGVS